MEKRVQPDRILISQSVGFLAIIAVCLFDDWAGLSALVFQDQAGIVNFREFALKMLVILCVWLIVGGSTRRILVESRHLAAFMRVCAWCRRIEHQGQWMPLEKFLRLGCERRTTHGICSECLQKARANLESAGQTHRPIPELQAKPLSPP
jgi:hypothetical protein